MLAKNCVRGMVVSHLETGNRCVCTGSGVFDTQTHKHVPDETSVKEILGYWRKVKESDELGCGTLVRFSGGYHKIRHTDGKQVAGSLYVVGDGLNIMPGPVDLSIFEVFIRGEVAVKRVNEAPAPACAVQACAAVAVQPTNPSVQEAAIAEPSTEGRLNCHSNTLPVGTLVYSLGGIPYVTVENGLVNCKTGSTLVHQSCSYSKDHCWRKIEACEAPKLKQTARKCGRYYSVRVVSQQGIEFNEAQLKTYDDSDSYIVSRGGLQYFEFWLPKIIRVSDTNIDELGQNKVISADGHMIQKVQPAPLAKEQWYLCDYEGKQRVLWLSAEGVWQWETTGNRASYAVKNPRLMEIKQ